MGQECGHRWRVSRGGGYYKTRWRPGKRRAASGRRGGAAWSGTHVDMNATSQLLSSRLLPYNDK